MLKVLSRAQADIREALFREASKATRPVLVAQEKELELGGPFERRMPFRYLLEHGAALTMLVVADDPVQGLWRDPVGDLAEDLFDGKEAVAQATAGYILLMEKGETDYVRRDLWDPMADVRAIVDRAHLDVPLPPLPQPEPTVRHTRTPVDSPAAAESQPPPAEPAPAEPPPPPPAPEPEPRDPFAVLGVKSDCSAEQLKQAFRALIVLYHPDKVAHLGVEFQELAERKTRELTVAYDAARRIVEADALPPSAAGESPET